MDALFHNRVPPLEELVSASKEELLKVHPCGCTHLRHAVQGGAADLEIMQLLINRAPEAFLITNKKGNAVLSCVREFTPPLIGCMVATRAPQEAFLQLDSDKDTPLHCVIQNRAANQVIQAYIKRSPQDVFVTANNDGKLPVHEAVRYGVDADTFRLLLENSPRDVLNTTDKGGDLPIHLLPRNASLELAQVVVNKSPPTTFSQANSHGRWPLHCAVAAGVSLEVFLSLINKTPANALSVKDKFGQLPLHMMGWQLSNEIVRELVDRSSNDALMTQDCFGRLPIHYLLQKGNATTDILKYVMEQSPSDCLSVADDEGRLPIHSIVTRRYPMDVVELLIRETPRTALLHPGQGGQTFLHLHAKNGMSHRVGVTPLAHVVMCMAQTAPELFNTADSTGQLPIHYAVQSSHSIESIQAFVTASPESLLQADNFGRLPLHLASSMSRLEVVKLLVDHPHGGTRTVQTPDGKGRLPLHCAIIDKASFEVMQQLVDSGGPDALLHWDNEGHLPLYHAFNTQNVDGTPRLRYRRRHRADTAVGWQLLVTTFLIERAPPEMLVTRGSRGQIPLHDAIDLGVSRELLQVLLVGYPDAVKVPDNSGRLPLHYAVARRRLPLESFQVILDAFPGAVCKKDSSGKIPLMVACDEDASLDVVFSLLLLNPQFLILSSNNENEA